MLAQNSYVDLQNPFPRKAFNCCDTRADLSRGFQQRHFRYTVDNREDKWHIIPVFPKIFVKNELCVDTCLEH